MTDKSPKFAIGDMVVPVWATSDLHALVVTSCSNQEPFWYTICDSSGMAVQGIMEDQIEKWPKKEKYEIVLTTTDPDQEDIVCEFSKENYDTLISVALSSFITDVVKKELK